MRMTFSCFCRKKNNYSAKNKKLEHEFLANACMSCQVLYKVKVPTTLNVLFRQITSFFKVRVAFVVGCQTL